MSRHIGWPERHGLGPTGLRRMADMLEMLDISQPMIGMHWTADIVAPSQAWEAFDDREMYPDPEKLVEEAMAEGEKLTPEERTEIRQRLANAFDRGALRAMLRGDLAQSDQMLRFAEVMEEGALDDSAG